MANGTRRNLRDIQDRARRRLAWLTEDGGLSQQEAGQRLGLLQQSVSRILKSTNGPILPICLLIGYVFGERCQELGLDPARVDDRLDAPGELAA